MEISPLREGDGCDGCRGLNKEQSNKQIFDLQYKPIEKEHDVKLVSQKVAVRWSGRHPA